MTTCDPIEMGSRSSLSSTLRLLLFLVMQGVAVILVGFAALFLSFEPVWSADDPQATFAGLSDARSGSLLLKTDDGGATDATRLGIDVDLTVSGPTIRARVTQIFRNPTPNWVEATYVYPLPPAARSIPSRWWSAIASWSAISRSGNRPASFTNRPARTDRRLP